jgi:ABC-type spermidine/putrescine transport system permease subunit II
MASSGRDGGPADLLGDVASVGALLALGIGFLTPLEEYSWMESPALSRIIDPDALLVATLMAVVAAFLAVVAIWRSRRQGRMIAGAVLVLSLVLCGRLAYIYVFTPELIWHQ